MNIDQFGTISCHVKYDYRRICLGNKEAALSCRNVTYWRIVS